MSPSFWKRKDWPLWFNNSIWVFQQKVLNVLTNRLTSAEFVLSTQFITNASSFVHANWMPFESLSHHGFSNSRKILFTVPKPMRWITASLSFGNNGLNMRWAFLFRNPNEQVTITWSASVMLPSAACTLTADEDGIPLLAESSFSLEFSSIFWSLEFVFAAELESVWNAPIGWSHTMRCIGVEHLMAKSGIDLSKIFITEPKPCSGLNVITSLYSLLESKHSTYSPQAIMEVS